MNGAGLLSEEPGRHIHPSLVSSGRPAGCSGGLTEERGAAEEESWTARTGAGRTGHGEGPGAAPGREDRGLANSPAASAETAARKSQSVPRPSSCHAHAHARHYQVRTARAKPVPLCFCSLWVTAHIRMWMEITHACPSSPVPHYEAGMGCVCAR